MRVMIVLWCAAGMFVSYMSGYTLMQRDLRSAERDIENYRSALALERGRVEVLESWSSDRDALDTALHGCYRDLAKWMDAFEDVKWQMGVVIDTCPGRERPPSLPRP